MIRRLSTIFVAAVLIGGGSAIADETPTVESLKEKAEADLKVETEKLKLKYLIALEKYQKSLAESGDLDGALAVKAEIDRAKEQEIKLNSGKVAKPSGSGSTSGSASGSKIILAGSDARLGNGTKYDRDRQLITGWSRYGAFAAWTLRDLKPGKYRATLHYRSGNLGGGVFAVRSSRGSGNFSIAGTGNWEDPKSQDLGQVYLSSSDHITVAALAGRNREIIYVESVELELIQSSSGSGSGR